MTMVEQLADFVAGASYDRMSEKAKETLKLHVLDALGCAIGAIDSSVYNKLVGYEMEIGDKGTVTLIGGGKTKPDRAALFNSALVRYLDFNDSYFAKGETCHPSDNLAGILAAAEYAGISGKEFLTALAVAYQIQCRLSDVAPVRSHGFDHTVQGSYAIAAGISRALMLDSEQTADAISITGTAFNALRVTRTGVLSNWKGLAYPSLAFSAMNAAFLAKHGITGPREVFEGNKGFMDAIAGEFSIDWNDEDLERITQTFLKKYNAEIHSQSAVEGVLELKHEFRFAPGDIDEIKVDIFNVAYDIIGGGEEGQKTEVTTKEESDHSLPYILAVALLDDKVTPEQYSPERITRDDVQQLLRKIKIAPNLSFSERFPEQMPCRITVKLKDGRVIEKSKDDYSGFKTRPMDFDQVAMKFDDLAGNRTDDMLRRQIIDMVMNLDQLSVRDLTCQLNKVNEKAKANHE
jgi:2-methylcitrate dehydratase